MEGGLESSLPYFVECLWLGVWDKRQRGIAE
jgi:hypothetical protein